MAENFLSFSSNLNRYLVYFFIFNNFWNYFEL